MTPFVDLTELPEIYAMRVVGSCMAPEIEDSSVVIVDQLSPCRARDLVVCYLRPELVKDGNPQGALKRLVLSVPGGVVLPFVANPGDELEPLLVLEQSNPRRQFRVRCSDVAALHRCVGPAEVTESGDCIVDPGQIADARRALP